jgi:HEAT repeat protein
MHSGRHPSFLPAAALIGAILAVLVATSGCRRGGLEGRTPDERAVSAAALGVNGADENVAVLVEAIETEPDVVQGNAITALGRIGTPAAVAGLAKFAHSEVSLTRRAVCQALQDVLPQSYPDAAKVLIEVGKSTLPKGPGNDPNMEVRRAAVTSLAVIQSPLSAEFLTDRALNDPEEGIRNASVKTLGRIKAPQAVDALMQIYEVDDEKNRAWAIEALGEIGDPRAIPTVIKALADYHGVTRGKAAWSLWQLEKAECAGPVQQALAVEQDDMPSIVMAHVLVLSGQPQAIEYIEDQLIRGRTNMARAEAARTLGEVGRKESVIALDRAFREDRDGLVLREASIAIKKLFEKYPGSESLVTPSPGS